MHSGTSQILAAAIVACLANEAYAQATPKSPAVDGADGASAPESAEYKTTVESALEEYRLQHFEEARTLFQRAHALDANARTLRGLGMVEFELRHYVAALQHLDAALANDKKPLTTEQRTSVEDLRKRAQQFVARYSLDVQPDSTAVRVELDGKPVVVSSDNHLSLEAGEHTLRVSTAGSVPRELHLDVKGGEQQTLRIELELKAAPSQAASSPPVQRLRPSPFAISLLGGGAAVAVGGGILGGLALHDANQANTRQDASADRAHTLALASDVAVGVGVAAVVAGGIMWILDARHAAADRAQPRLTVYGQSLRVGF